nr:hypothetical protein HK105_004823 [Polyrhizophydium stewartii]
MGNDTAPTQHDTAGDHVVPSAGRPPSPVEQPLPGAAAGVSLPNTTRLGPYPGARSPHRGAEDDVDEAMRAMVATAMPAAAARVSASVDSLAGAHGTDPHGIAAADGPRALSASSGDLLLSHAELSGAVSASLLATVAGDLGPASRGAPADDHGQDERTGRPEWRPRRQSASMSASKLSWRRPLPSNSPTRHRSTSMLSQQLARYEGIPERPAATLESPSFMGSLWEYVKGELTSSDFEESQDFKTERIRNFLSVPRELEKLLFFGYLICLDSFLYIFTILPLRMVIALWSMLGWCFGGPSLKPAQKTDLVKGALVGICSYLLQYFDASRLYHAVRGQALIKLYVIFNVLEICDKLCSAFGHDILDSLFSTSFPSRSAPVARRFSRITHFVVASMYIFAHSLVLFYQVMTLNVAVNSYNNALMTLLLSNQFVEIKGSVFKRFEKENLFQLSCADVVERFQLSVFLVIIATRNCIEIVGGNGDLSLPAFFAGLAARFTSLASLPSTVLVAVRALSSAPVDDLWALLSDTCTVLSTSISAILKSEEFKMLDVLLTPVLIVYATEILVDWLKHAFITKFNNISPSVYQRYNDSLCRDLLGARKTALPPQPAPQQYHPQQRSMIRDDTVADPMQMSAVDRSPIVARRIGFVSIPLACLVVRVGIQTFKMVLAQQSGYAEMQTPSVSALDAIDPDSPSEWSSSFAMPAWLSRTELDFTWTKHTVELYHYAAVGLVCYFM